MVKNRSTSLTADKTAAQQRRIFAALVATMLVMGAGVTVLQAADAAPEEFSQSAASEVLKSKADISESPASETARDGDRRLPPRIANAVRQDLSRKVGINPGRLKITEFSSKTWSDGCLGLGRPEESCLQALVPGWRVVLSDGSKTWVYRTDTQGRTLRLEDPTSSVNLPKSVSDAVLQDAQQRSKLPISALSIVEAQKKTWNNGCLGLASPGVFCTQALVDGWRVTVKGNQQRWVYRTNASGSAVKFDEAASRTSDANLPEPISQAVLQQASQQLGVSVSAASIVNVEQKQWSNPCIFNFGKVCTREYNPVAGWQVTVASRQQRLVYRTDRSGSRVMLDKEASQISDAGLPEIVSTAVLQQASEQLGMPVSALSIVKTQQKKWPDKCLGISSPLVLCGPTRDGVPGWLVTAAAGEQRLVYRTNEDGSLLKLDAVASLPESIAKAVLRDVRAVSRSPISALRIVQAQKQTWDGCLGVAKPGVACTQIGIPGWQVTVTDGQQLWVYHTDNNSRVVLNESASKITDAGTLKATKMPKSELPPPLAEGEIFRTSTTGGFVGRTYQTTLMNDGRVIRVLVSRNYSTASAPQIRQISRQQVQQFQQLLDQQRFSRFNQLMYLPPKGAADFITVTIASPTGVVQYADMVQNRLPLPLQQVIQAWNQIARD